MKRLTAQKVRSDLRKHFEIQTRSDSKTEGYRVPNVDKWDKSGRVRIRVVFWSDRQQAREAQHLAEALNELGYYNAVADESGVYVEYKNESEGGK